MKNTLIIILAIAAMAAGAFCIVQRSRSRAASSELTETQTRLAAAETQLKQQADAVEHARISEAKTSVLQKTLTEASAEAVQQSKQTEQLKQTLAAAKTNSPLKGFAAMFKSPELRKMMAAQQKAMMGPMIAKQYSDLFQQLNFTPEQTDAFKTLLQNKQLAGVDSAMSLLDDSLDASQRAALQAQIKSQNGDFDNQLKQLLGSDNYEAYQAYNKTIPARTTVNQFMDQETGTPNALRADQQQQLIQAMTDANSNYKWTSLLNQRNSQTSGQTVPMDAFKNLTEDNINQAAQEQEQFDQQLFTTVQQILTPAQAAAFQQFQSNMRQMQISSMKMAAQMFPHGSESSQ
jgi:hypothetical protein